MSTPISRRALIATGAAAAVAAAPVNEPRQSTPICGFSKHFQWLPIPEAAKLAKEIGYDGLDLTVRAAGHVLPERVADDLPKAAEAIRAAGLSLPMITAGIVDVRSPHAAAILETSSALGIKRYRWGGFRYDAKKPVVRQIAEFKAMSKDLAALNKQFGMCAMYHTHSGAGQFGASIWDIWEVLRDLDNNAVSLNLDVGHATVEGGLGGWINSTRLTGSMIRGVAFKDFRWEKKRGKWDARWCALGEGMVNFPQFAAMLKDAGFQGPIQLHMEYEEVGDAHAGKPSMSISKEEFVRLCKADLAALRGYLRPAGLA
ncbi:MAG: TIM barrel protein [Bryobacteraceae bacterium]